MDNRSSSCSVQIYGASDRCIVYFLDYSSLVGKLHPQLPDCLCSCQTVKATATGKSKGKRKTQKEKAHLKSKGNAKATNFVIVFFYINVKEKTKYLHLFLILSLLWFHSRGIACTMLGLLYTDLVGDSCFFLTFPIQFAQSSKVQVLHI